MNNLFQNRYKLHPSGLLAFILGISVVLLGYFINSLGIRPLDYIRNSTHLISPKPAMENVLEEKIRNSPKNTFLLKRNSSFVPQASADYNVQANSYIVTDASSGKILLEKNSDEAVNIASITKLMSAVVTLDLVNKDELFTITKNAAAQTPTKIGVVAGQKMKVSELLMASLLTSANDATEALRDGVDNIYGKGSFVRAMNEKANYLGLSDSNFSNPQGYDLNNYSTAADVAVLSSYILKNYPFLSEIVKKDYAFLPEDNNHKQFDLYNWNGLLGVYPGVIGLKIGNTKDAGFTTVVAAERNNHKLIAVILGTAGVKERDIAASQALDAGFERVGIKPAKITEENLLTKYHTWKYWN